MAVGSVTPKGGRTMWQSAHFAHLWILGLLVLLLFSTVLAAQTQPVDLTPYCTRQDRQFVDNFEKFGALGFASLAAFVLPFLSAMIPFQSWRLLNPHKRWAILAVTASLVVLAAFAGLPMLAASRWFSAENGLLVYPGVEADYITRCRAVRVRGTPLFGFLGDGNTTAIGQPYYLLLGLVMSLVIWTGIVWLVFRLARKRFGLIPQ